MAFRTFLPLAPILLLVGFWAVANGVVSRETPDGPHNRVVVQSSAAAEIRTGAPGADAQCELVAAKLQTALGEIGNVVVASPFVIGGDFPRAELHRWRDSVVLPAAGALSASYFPAPIEKPIVILLLADREAYRAACRKTFQADAPPCDGFFDAEEGMIVIDVATGEGTLVHELTHAMMHYQCPQAPQWFNEGLASLNESVKIVDGPNGPALRPQDNWRLGVLREAASAQRFPHVRDLIEGNRFQTGDLAVNYALARAFCHFVHDEGKLLDLLDRIRTTGSEDPSGALAVQAIFPNQSWTQIEDDFNRWLVGRSGY
ncbi:MAG TPA: DUF1570 domain-containing protein [Pirellulales bacterium]